MILLIGSSIDKVFGHLAITASGLGYKCRVVDPSYDIIRLGSLQNAIDYHLSRIDGSINGAFFRFCRVGQDNNKHKQCNCVFYEIHEKLQSAGIPCVSCKSEKSTNSCKFAHLWKLQEQCVDAGLKVPETIVTNRKEDIVEFIKKHNGYAISKGLSSTKTLARLVTIEDIQQADIEHPILIQEYVSGDNIRVHSIGVTNIAERIVSSSVDYRKARNNLYVRVEIDSRLRKLQENIMLMEGLELAGFDYIENERGLYFLEVNGQPDFRGSDLRTNFSISRAIAKFCTPVGMSAPA